jgi:tetratricopeptide (TPR) repeat protein
VETLILPYPLAERLFEFGLMYREKGEMEEARRYLNKSLEIWEDLDNRTMAEKIEKELREF